MGDLSTLKAAVQAAIRTNGNQEITGQVLQNTLTSIINTLGTGAQYMGIATPTTNPGTPDAKVFYIASANGTYSNFGGITVNNEVVILVNSSGSWVKQSTGFATIDGLNNVINQIGTLSNLQTTIKTNLVAAINEVLTTFNNKIGNLSSLTTEAKTNLVAAINEVLTTFNNKIGNLSSLTTEAKTNLVAAINEVRNNIINVGSNIDALLGVETEIINPSIFQLNQVISWETGKRTTYNGSNINNVVTLNAGETIIAKVNAYESVAVFAKNTNSGGWVDPSTPLVRSAGSQQGAKYYYYTASVDNEYILTSYIVADGIELKKVKVGLTDMIVSVIKKMYDPIISGLDGTITKLGIGSVHIEIGKNTAQNGGLWARSNGATTGVIPNTKNLMVYCPKNYQIACFYGNTKTLLTDASYIKTGYDAALFNLSDKDTDTHKISDAKYIALNLVAASAIPTDSEINLVLADKDSADAYIFKELLSKDKSVNEKIDTISVNVDRNNYKIEFLSNGKLSNTVNAVAGVDYLNKIPLSFKSGDVIEVMYESQQSSGTIAIIGSNSFTALTYCTKSWTTLTFAEDVEYIALSRYRTLVVADGSITFKIRKPTSTLNQRLKMMQFTDKSVTISDSKETLAICDDWDVDDFGNVCAGMCSAENAVGEYGTPSWKSYLLTCNLADVEGTRKQILCFDHGMIDGFGYIESVQHVGARWTDEDEITVLTQVIYRPFVDGTYREDRQYSSYVARIYTPSTNSWSEPIVADINISNVVHPITYKTSLVDGVWKVLQETISEVEQIWTTTGIWHESSGGEEGGGNHAFEIAGDSIKINDFWYRVIQIGCQSNVLIRSMNYVNWHFVCDLNPINQWTLGEVTFSASSDRVYMTCRGQFNSSYAKSDGKTSKVLYCSRQSFISGNPIWSTPKDLIGCGYERPTIAVLNDKVYLLHGTGQSPITEGKTIARGKKVLFTLDKDLNILTQDTLDFTYPLLHPYFRVHGGNLFMVTSSDKRCLAWTKGGDGRDEISIAHLDEHILGL